MTSILSGALLMLPVSEGEAGHRWYRWVFHASSAVHHVLDPARSVKVVTDELDSVQDLKEAIVSCDRYSASFMRMNCRQELQPG